METSRLTAYSAAATALALYSDPELGKLVEQATPLGSGIGGRSALLEVAGGEPPAGVPEAAAAILTRHSPLAIVMDDFYRRLQRESRETPYPLEEIERLPL